MKKNERKSALVSVRMEPSLKEQLYRAARRLDLSENDIARHALRAAIQIIEANHYQIKLPLKLGIIPLPFKKRTA